MLGSTFMFAAFADGAAPPTEFWSGGIDSNWTNLNNWRTSINSNAEPISLPGIGTNVTFYTTTPPAGILATNLGQDFEINSLSFISTASRSVDIAAGHT